jgi:peptidoglycan/xylan/chitin deacetylase (PgdA/CDA1 family)
MKFTGRVLRKIRNVSAPRLSLLAGGFRSVRRRSVAILMYHGVTDQQTAIPDWCQVRVDDFREQMEFLRTCYRVLPLSEVTERVRRGAPLPDRTVCLTFDDGFQSFFDQAWPVLTKFHFPATVFLITSLLENRLPPWPGRLLYALSTTKLDSVSFCGTEWRLSKGRSGLSTYEQMVNRLKVLPFEEREYQLACLLNALSGGFSIDFARSPRITMGWKELDSLAHSDLVSFGSHTHTHASLSNCSCDEQRRELECSRDVLRERLPMQNLFCYPFGDWSAATTERVLEAGYCCALTTVPGLNASNADVYSLRRVGIGAGMRGATFEMAILGWCE